MLMNGEVTPEVNQTIASNLHNPKVLGFWE